VPPLNVVVDASVIVKWILPASRREEDLLQALILLEDVRLGRVVPCQPPHWLAEVTAVLARLDAENVEAALDLLTDMGFPVIESRVIFKRASRIACELNHHLFDTLYHALALETGLTLISADEAYFLKARRLGGIMRLASWQGPPIDLD